MAANTAKKPRPSKNRVDLTSLRKALTQKPEQRAIPKGSQGTTTKVGICHFVSALLEVNEKLPKSKKLNDTTLKAALIQEFPKARSVVRLKKGELSFGYWRTLYNLGHFTGGKKPKVKSLRYGNDGEPVNRKGNPIKQ